MKDGIRKRRVKETPKSNKDPKDSNLAKSSRTRVFIFLFLLLGAALLLYFIIEEPIVKDAAKSEQINAKETSSSEDSEEFEADNGQSFSDRSTDDEKPNLDDDSENLKASQEDTVESIPYSDLGKANFETPNVENEPEIQRVVAVGDLHGDLLQALKTFRLAGIIDNKGDWIAGKTILVQTGDIVDRGDDTIRLYKLMQNLAQKAEQAGGKVHALLGNHEVLNLGYEWQYVTEGDIKSFGSIDNRIYAWSKGGWIGKYLYSLNLTVEVQGTVFFHGGANPNWANLKVDGINSLSKKILNDNDPLEFKFFSLFQDDGPLWYRGYANDPEYFICKQLDDALEKFNAKRMVVGHTPQLNGMILSRCDGKMFVIDVGISRLYGGNSAALEILGDEVYALYRNGIKIRLY